jgi:hypothetical protein
MKKLKENAEVYLYFLVMALVIVGALFIAYVKFMAYWKIAFG